MGFGGIGATCSACRRKNMSKQTMSKQTFSQ